MKRFWDKVSIGEPDACWLWTAYCEANGYGRFRLGGAARPAHRVAYELAVGAIPEGLVIRHKCDVRACCNPAHLELGTKADNTGDMLTRGREAAGEKNGQAKLTDAQVDEIRARAGVRGMQVKLAAEFGVTKQQINKIVNGKSRRTV